MASRTALVLSAEHAGRDVPRRWAALFAGAEALLASHRGVDIGSLELARSLRGSLRAPLVATTTTRLLVDCNRSPAAPGLFSELTRDLPESERARIVARCHAPHRAAVADAITAALGARERVLHVAVHTFTPVWKGREREVDVGLLFDPRRPREAELVRRWRRALVALEPKLRVRLNRPYRGWTDGLCTSFRGARAPARYAGIELEVNQAFPTRRPERFRRLQESLALSLRSLLD